MSGLSAPADHPARQRFLTTGDVDTFERTARILFGGPVGVVEQVRLSAGLMSGTVR